MRKEERKEHERFHFWAEWKDLEEKKNNKKDQGWENSSTHHLGRRRPRKENLSVDFLLVHPKPGKHGDL